MSSSRCPHRRPLAVDQRAYDGCMKQRTRAYWPTRILLAVGFSATVIALTFIALTFAPLADGPMSGPRPAVLGLPVNVLLSVVGLVQVLVGFGWMVRIFRGSRDEPPAWRYRDR